MVLESEEGRGLVAAIIVHVEQGLERFVFEIENEEQYYASTEVFGDETESNSSFSTSQTETDCESLSDIE